LPNHSEREQIFQVHLSHLRRARVKNNEFDLKLLANSSQDFSGAEIEQIIYEAMQNGFSEDREFSQDDLLSAIAETTPLSRIAKHQIDALKDWAIRSGAKNATKIESKINSSNLPLEVDF
jgi:SpoVK/Ycf46/Vps4 family AAA+-type ATPase